MSNKGFNINDPFGEEKPRKAYDQDTDFGINASRKENHIPESQKNEIYREYMRQYEQSKKRDDEDIMSDSSFKKERPVNKRKKVMEDKVNLSEYSYKAKRNKKKKKKKKAIIISVTSIVVILGVLTYLLWPFLNYNFRKISKDKKNLGFDKIINEKIINIALFGLDTREENCFEGRSDSIMILSLNTEEKKVKVLSLMRDTLVNIPDKDGDYFSKINAAYSDGGPELAIKTINKTFNLDISNYATINFFGMVDIIDAVGGIDATITEDELEWKGYDNPNLNNCMEEICAAKGLDIDKYLIHSPGKHHLNGVQAVAYSRIRHCLSTFGTNDDFGRTDRQRYVMQQLFSKAITLKKTQYIKLAKALLPCSETSLTLNEILSLCFNILLKHPKFEQYRIPQTEWLMPFDYEEYYVYGSCVYFDLDYATRAIHAIIYDGLTIEQFVEQNDIEKNDWFARYGTKLGYSPEPLPETGDDGGYEESGDDGGYEVPEEPIEEPEEQGEEPEEPIEEPEEHEEY